MKKKQEPRGQNKVRYLATLALRAQVRDWLQSQSLPLVVNVGHLCAQAGFERNAKMDAAFSSVLRELGWVHRTAVIDGRVLQSWSTDWGAAMSTPEGRAARKVLRPYTRRVTPQGEGASNVDPTVRVPRTV